MTSRLSLLCLLTLTACIPALGVDWDRFRGPNGSGVSPDSIPTEWSESKNVKWRKDLPGPGLSSPIVVGDRVFVTCWTGYAAGDDQGAQEDLKRNLLCLDRNSGEVVWSQAEDAILPEDNFRGMFAENGYASHTPATDGERVFVFYGKTGVLAYRASDGERLWQRDVGSNLEQKGWGSASSPIVYNGTVIVPAFIENDSLVALDTATGEVAWEQKVPGYTSNWSTPILVEANDRTDLVLTVPGEVWGLNPSNGKLRWYCEIPGSTGARASVVADEDIVFAMAGGRGARTSVAVRAGGKGDVAETHKIWQGSDVSSIATPVIHDDRIYLVNGNVVTSVDVATGKRIKQQRLRASTSSSSATRQRGGRRRGRGGQDYSSPVIAGNKLYYASRAGDVFVMELNEDMTQIAANRLDDGGQYNASPAISNGELFVRSTKAIYCLAE